MEILEAAIDDFEETMTFYNDMCEVLNEKDFLPNGDKGGFPSRDMVLAAIAEHGQFIGVEDGKIVAAYIMNHHFDESYRTVEWKKEVPDEKISVIHALRVHPRCGGRGYSKRLMEHAIHTARERGQESMRLDVLVGNSIPEKMYGDYGFEYVGTVDIFYEDIGETMQFRLMELVL